MQQQQAARAFLFAITALLLVFQADAISISGPISGVIDFEPGLRIERTFYVTDFTYNASVFSRGTLNEYLHIGPLRDIDEQTKAFDFYIELPEKIEPPGYYTVMVGVVDVTGPSSQAVGGVASVAKLIKVLVLSEDKQMTGELKAGNINVGDQAELTVDVKSLTKQVINNAGATIEIYGHDKLITTISTDSTSLQPGEEKTLTATLDSTNILPGEYTAKAKISYDGNIIEKERSFLVGSLKVKIVDFPPKIIRGSINKFNINVQSGWNNLLEDVYAEVFIDGSPMMKTTTEKVHPWLQRYLTGYLDATDLELGEHNIRIVVHYAGKVAEKNSVITVVEGEAQEQEIHEEKPAKLNTTVIFMGAAVVILIIILAVNMIWISKIMKAKHKPKRK